MQVTVVLPDQVAHTDRPSLRIMKTNKLLPIHPGEILRVELMKPRGLSQNALALALHVSRPRINGIVLESAA